MTDAIATIERVLKAGILSPRLTVIPDRGASEADFAEEERLLPRPISPGLRRLLTRWNGLNLDVLRVYGCGSVQERIKRLSAHQIPLEPEEVAEINQPMVIGSDPSGFIYIEDAGGPVWCLDTDGGELELLAADLADLLGRVVFGDDAEAFAGADWAQTLRKSGLIA